MKKLLSIVIMNIFVVTILVGCGNEGKISDEEIENIKYQETVINDLYNKVQDKIAIIDGYIESKYENKSIDSDELRNCQKSMREISRDLENINLDEMKEYYTNENNINKYNELKNKYNQINRSVKYTDGIADMLKDDTIDDNEVLTWICMREICNSDTPLSDEMKDNDEYKSIVEKYGFSLIDKQNEFDKKYEVKDVN
ncbi:hypothetical protein [Terrisporobacter glycolicus]|uniref:hypothetical protein n=1 Tax=Terrisporobacter glycolicus TaxID=36841 RepID=UPI003464BE7A